MKKIFSIRSLAMLVLLTMLLCSVVACGPKDEPEESGHVDYAAELKLDMDSDSLKQEVSVHIYIDGDTTHFNVPESVMEGGILKARYLAINTPESTGRIEPWGKAASNFTKERLKNATSIIIESDNGTWNADSTGGRYLVWVWYKTADMTDYRNLNLEILQNGLAIASNSAQNRYGEICVKAIDQAKAEKLYVHSTEQDPDFHYGAAQEMTLKELRSNITSYEGTKVAFEGVISAIYDGSFYVEEYDEETGMSYGVSAYYQTGGLPGKATEFIQLGNRVRVVGSVTYFEAGDIWQVSGLSYSLMKPDDPSNFQLISSDNEVPYKLTDPAEFFNKRVTMIVSVTEDGETVEKEKTFSYAELALDTSISMNDLVVVDTRTNKNNEITLYCNSNGVRVQIFLGAMRDEAGHPVAASTYMNKIINVRGLVDKYYENYQIRVLTYGDITVVQ